MWPSAIDAAVFSFGEVGEDAGRVFTSADGKTEIEDWIAFVEQGAGTESSRT